ncbi:hypothetical protein SCP_0100530 [Sparassis crispa]|uniref:Uncharacterized protein n=1 Tax=Sparassis crispa TaxID=139825 RepID=A0A401G4T4_9APHY|nr:hypothetical protein SCP_0100530 [Sparassis crispa]GBE77181.1 hypothetical protein SCP_0100530 [Sparassis crispa]
MFPESIKISDDAVSTNQCIIPLSRGRRKGAARPPISIFGRAAKGKRLIRLTIYPDHKEPMLRPEKITKPAQTAAGGWFAWLPWRWRSSAPAPTSTKPSGLPYAHKLAAYPLHHAAVTRLPWSSDVEARVLPGAYRAIAYFVRLEDQREEAPRILEFHCLSDPRSGSPAAAAAAAQNPCKPLLAAKFAVPREVEELRTVGALAWDETIGRLCIAEGNAMMVHVLDFAESPAFEAEQDFYVFEYPDTDIFDRPYSRKAHETRDVGPGSANEGDWEYSPGPSHGRSSGAGGPGGTTEAGCSYWPSGTQGAQSSREPDATKEAGCSYWPSALDGPEFSHCANGTKGAESSRDPDATKEAGCSIWPSALDGPESSHWENGTDRAESSNRPSRMNGVNRLPDEEMPDWMADWVNNNADLMNGAEEMNGAGQADSAGQGNCTDASVPMDTT